jgi:hypothetical protein
MKKIMALVAIAALAIGVTGCKKEKPTTGETVGAAVDSAAADAKATATDAKAKAEEAAK